MKVVFITIAEDIIARNIFFTDFWNEFKNNKPNIKIIFLVQPDRVDYFKEVLGGENIIIEGYKRSKSGWFEDLIMSFARSGINSKTNLWSKMRSYNRGDSLFIATYFKRFCSFAFGWSNLYKNFLRQLILFVRPDGRLKELFDTYNPSIIFATSMTNFDFDVLISREAKRRVVRIVGMVRSWDNLSSHGLLRVLPNRFILQNIFLKDMANIYQAIDTKKVPIDIIGLPHYDQSKDFYKVLLSREDFLKSVGLKEKQKYIFYGAMGEFLFKHENELPEVFDRLISSGALSKDLVFLYRAHPKFPIPPNKIKNLKNVFFDVVGKYIDQSKKTTARNENEHLINAIYHSEVVTTGASTIAIDAAVIDKPVVCVGFDGVMSHDKVNYWDSVKRFYDSYTHFEALVDTRSLKVAFSENDFVKQIDNYIKNPVLDREGRQRAVDLFVAPFDGRAGERLTNIFIEEINLIIK